MIPKVIHYCWFGGKALPDDAKRCIASWQKFLPDYEIKRWDESNFDINAIRYTKEAYVAKKYAFVSDYARFVVLHKEGGLYFDTDVEVIGSMDDIIQAGAFLGVEKQSGVGIDVAPGLGMGAEPGNAMLGALIEAYKTFRFVNEDGTYCYKNIVQITTEYLLAHGLKNTEDIQTCCGFTIYPKEYFCPVDYTTRECKITLNTRAIHHYAESWVPRSTRLKNALSRIFGKDFMQWLVSLKSGLKSAKH